MDESLVMKKFSLHWKFKKEKKTVSKNKLF
jgi:hypothetical protein